MTARGGGYLRRLTGVHMPPSCEERECVSTGRMESTTCPRPGASGGELQVPADTCSDSTPHICLTGNSTAGVGRWVRVVGSGDIVSSSLRKLEFINFEPCLRECEGKDDEGLHRSGGHVWHTAHGTWGVGRMFPFGDGPSDPNGGSWDYLLWGYAVRLDGSEGSDRTCSPLVVILECGISASVGE